MFCPNCGTKNEVQQSFCRACGMGLKEVLESLSKNAGIKVEDTDWLKKLGVFSIGGFGALIICLLTIVIFNSLSLHISAAFIFMMMLFGLTVGYLSVILFDRHQLKKAIKSNAENFVSPPQVERWNTNKQLNESSFEPISSVTEKSTELFYVEKLKRRTSGDLN